MICVNLFLICVSRILSGISTQLFRNVFRVPLWYKWLLGYRMWLFKENYFRILQKWKYMRPNDRIQFLANFVETYFSVNLPRRDIYSRKFWFFELSIFWWEDAFSVDQLHLDIFLENSDFSNFKFFSWEPAFSAKFFETFLLENCDISNFHFSEGAWFFGQSTASRHFSSKISTSPIFIFWWELALIIYYNIF